jgi:VCBS repeat-containing protein
VGGRGGDGKSASWITSVVATDLAVGQTSAGIVYFAGGGGGGMGADGQPGVGGLGGGANGTRAEPSGNAGSAFTGGGGGGSGFDDISKSGSLGTAPNPPAGAGGSGVVVVRFAIPDTTAPTFTNSTTFSIAENTATSTNAATITVNESSTITITSGTDSARFTLVTSDSVTARIRFAAIPNFEAPADVGTNNVYDISVRATDTAGNIANQSISITVTNVNEAPSISSPSANETHTITQAENISTVVTYTATDVDAGTTLSWSLSGTDAADFSINSSSGVLAFSSNPDFEAPADSDTNNSYIIIVAVSDGSLTDTQTVTITITNANESASINAPTVSGVVFKGVVETITVTINVAGKVRFFVGGKRISTCKDRTTSGTYPNNTATCSWRPAVMGRQVLTATLTPTDNTFSASTSAPTTVQVVRRSTTR